MDVEEILQQLRMRDVLVWDASSLSHAFEDLGHAAISAYGEMKPPKNWPRLAHRLERRFRSEYLSRRLLLICSKLTCIIPSSVKRELERNPRFRDSLLVVTGNAWQVESFYARRTKRSDVQGFSMVWRATVKEERPSPEAINYVRRVAERLGIMLAEGDIEGIALAWEKRGILVTADRRQAELARTIGVRVLFTI